MDLIEEIFISDIRHPIYDPWRDYTDFNYSYLKSACPKQNAYRDFTWDQFCKALGLEGALQMMGNWYCRFDSYKGSILCRTYREMVEAFNESRQPTLTKTNTVVEEFAEITPVVKNKAIQQIKKKPKKAVTAQLF